MQIQYVKAKTIVTKSKSPSSWFGMDYNMNIYRGCSHGCIYCDSRSDCYGIEEFDRVRVKENALELIRNDLRRKVKTGVVASGAMSDPYNPLEKQLKLTRHALELCDAFGFGAAIATKSTGITRDIDILKGITEHSPVLIKLTITTADDELASQIEPGVPPSSERFNAIHKLREQGIYTGILLMPVLPFLNDTVENVTAIVKKAHECGAKFIYPAFGMTLRGNQRSWYFDRLHQLFPGRNLVEQYLSRYGERYNCTSPKARKLWSVFSELCMEKGILYKMDDIIYSYKKPYFSGQMNLFDFI